MKKKIEELKEKYNISEIGFLNPRKLSELEEYLDRKVKVEFEEKDTEKRINPFLLFDNLKSIIVLAFNYYQKPQRSTSDSKYMGKISISSWGEDYHEVIKRYSTLFIEELIGEKDINYSIYVDTQPLPERYLASLSGVGNIGKNTSLITKEGSFVFLSTIYLDFDLDFNIFEYKNKDICGECDKCLKACPTKAISEDGFNPTRCISYLTQTKNTIDDELLVKMGNSIYGCDICQLACPYNKDVQETLINEFKTDFDPFIDLLEFIDISNKDFKKLYGPISGSWRGKNVLVRNALISLYNLGFRDKEVFIEKTKSNSKLISDCAKQILNLIERE